MLSLEYSVLCIVLPILSNKINSSSGNILSQKTRDFRVFSAVFKTLFILKTHNLNYLCIDQP